MAQTPESLFDEILGRESWNQRPAILGPAARTYGDLFREAGKIAAVLTRDVGSRRTVALMFHPSANFIASLIAIAISDNIAVPINPGASADEKSFVLSNAGCRLLLTDLAVKELPGQVLLGQKTLDGDLSLVEFDIAENFTPHPKDRMIVHTSGSTGRPKGVILSDAALSNNARAVADDVALCPGDRTIFYTPTAFVYATNQVLSQLVAGGAIFPWSHGLLFPGQILRAIDEHRVTNLNTNVPSLRLWATGKEAQAMRLESVRCIVTPGQQLLSSVARKAMNVFPNARMVSAYGCTENAPRICHYWTPTEFPEGDTALPITQGPALDGVEVRIVDGDGNPVQRGETGELVISGTSLMRGYLHLESLTAERVRNGWYHTGDLAELTLAGEYVILGRVDNIISVGHEKVAPEEVEALIEKVSGVKSVAVGHMPDQVLGKACCAIISTDDSTDLVNRVLSHCRKNLSANKVPKRIILVDEVPATLYGKIDRPKVQACIETRLSEQ